MTTWVLAAIDGTGSSEWRGPDGPGSKSHVYKFKESFRSVHKKHWDGPESTVLGSDVETIRDAVLEWLDETLAPFSSKRNAGPASLPEWARAPARAPIVAGLQTVHPREDVKVCLAGHSRGGLIAIAVARELSRRQFPVHFLALYDCVDMTPFEDGKIISNVHVTYHAVRNPAFGSRRSWGNAGRENNAEYHERFFNTSHGGIGGDPVLKPKSLIPMKDDYACDVTSLKAGVYSLLGRRLDDVCIAEAKSADRWVREGAARSGVPIGM